MKKRVALCIPNYEWQSDWPYTKWVVLPYAVCMLAAVIRHKVDVDIIDAYKDKLSVEEFSTVLSNKKYDFVGISVFTDQGGKSGHRAAKIAKEVLPHAVVAMGGVYATINYAKIVNDSNVDYVCIGEGEELLPSLLDYLWENGPLPKAGLAFYSNGKLIQQGKAQAIQNLDALPFPAYDMVDFEKYLYQETKGAVNGAPATPSVHLTTSRGCPQKCCFCQVKHISGQKFRPRSASSILEEIALYKEQFAIKSFMFDDDNLVAQRSRAVKIFQGIIDRNLVMPWNALNIAVFKLDPELIFLMAQSGCKYMSVSVESGSPRVLQEIIDKPIDYEYAKKMIQCARNHGIFVAVNFVVGFPTETWDEIQQTIAMAEQVEADYVNIFVAIPLQHTALWDLCLEHNSFREDFSPDEFTWNAGQIQSEHFDVDELTYLRAYEWDRINFTDLKKRQKTAQQMNISLEELDVLRRNTRLTALNRIKNTSGNYKVNIK